MLTKTIEIRFSELISSHVPPTTKSNWHIDHIDTFHVLIHDAILIAGESRRAQVVLETAGEVQVSRQQVNRLGVMPSHSDGEWSTVYNVIREYLPFPPTEWTHNVFGFSRHERPNALQTRQLRPTIQPRRWKICLGASSLRAAWLLRPHVAVECTTETELDQQ
jgi:hypothetical protein